MRLLLPRAASSRRRPLDWLVLAIVLVVAAAFRFHALDWDTGTHQHPDERFLTDVATKVALPNAIGDYFDTARASLNPYARGFERYAYGQLPLSLTRLVAERTGQTDFQSIYLPGRVLSGLADLGTIIFAWLLARRVFGTRHAHLTAILLALSVLPIQLAHFFTVDTFVTCFAAACLYFGQRAWQRESLVDALVAGAMAGLAVACKISAATLLPVLCLVFLWPRHGRLSRPQVLDGLTAFGVALLGAFALIRLAEPYAFLGPAVWGVRLNPAWFIDKAYQAEVSSGVIDVPFNIQWAGTPAYALVAQSIVQWGMGPALGIASLVGLGLCAWRLGRGRPQEREALLVLAWAALNLLYFGGQFAKYMRYLVPAYFALALLASYIVFLASDALASLRQRLLSTTAISPSRAPGDSLPLERLQDEAGSASRVPRDSLSRQLQLKKDISPSRGRGSGGGPHLAWLLTLLRHALAPALVGATAAWALAFSSIYAQPHSRIQASEWMYTNIPASATLATEHWDDRLPLLLSAGPAARRYRYVDLTLYDPETEPKRTRLLDTLDATDYVVLASRRLVDSIPRLPERYPLATTYYRLLLSGQLGFERVARFQVEPRLGPFAIDDSQAQEDFTVYDHPTVEIWRKRPDYASAQMRQLLGAVPLDRVVEVRAVNGGKGALLESPAEQQTRVAGGTWSELFQRDSLANRVPLLAWLLAAELIALVTLPVLWRSLPFLPDRGFGASKILGLALLAYLGWLLASLHLAPFERGTLLALLALLAAASIAVSWRQRLELSRWLKREARLLVTVEAVFLGTCALILLVRAANPDLWHNVFGGEKPMNFAYLNAVVKSQYFPPYDPWFAGGIINYYYFGFVLVATLVELTGVLPQLAFNLAQGTIFGALCAGAFSLALALSIPLRRGVARTSAYVAGFAAVALVGFLGNLDAGLQVLERLWRIGGAQAPDSSGVGRFAAGLLAVLQGQPFPWLDFWRSTRFIGPEDAPPIHEFPYFTFLYGDLHAHQLALPLTVAVLLVALNLVRAVRAAPHRVPWVPLVWAGLLVGMLRATNTWDFPPYAAIVGLALVLGYAHGLLGLRRASIQALVVSGVAVAALSQVLFWPFLQRYQLFYTGVTPLSVRTSLAQYLTIHGLLLFLAGSLLVWYLVLAWRRAMVARAERALVPEAGYYGVVLPVGFLGALTSPARWVLLLGIAASVLLLVAGFATRAFIVVAVAAATAACLGHWRQSSRAFQAALLGAGLFATLVPELVALQGDVGRMNTVFKFYLQAWILFAVAGAVALGWLARRARRDLFLRVARPAWLALAVLLVSSAAAYPLLASPSKLAARFTDLPPSLDGMAFLDHAVYVDSGNDLNLPADAEAIRWLQDNVVGTPVVLEGRAPVYRWGSRIAVYTGLPTILGWDVHQGQQRAGYISALFHREDDVERAYASTNRADALAVLRTYAVRWVVIGGLERAYYPAAGIEKFHSMPELRLAYDRDGVQIYEVMS